MGRYVRMVAVAAMGLAGAGALVIALSGGASATQTCTDSFTNALGGAWGTNGNWSNNAPPTAGDDACIGDTTGGSYTVIGSGAMVAHSITIGGSHGGTQTLNVQGNGLGNASLSLGAGVSAIKSNGALVMDSTNGDFAQLIGSSTLTNNGSFSTVQDGGGTRYVEVPLTNAGTGTVTISAADTRQDNGTLTSNSAAFTVASGGSMALTGGSSFTNSAGTLTATGTFTETGGTFTESGGNEAGANPAVIWNATMVDSAGTGSFLLQGSDTLSGTIPSLQTVNVQGNGAGNALTTLSGTVINNGTLQLDSTNGDYADIGGTGSLDNKGLVKTLQHAGGVRYFQAAVTNESGATIEIASTDTRQDNATLTTNKGSFTVDSTFGFVVSANSSFTNSAGSLTVNGAFTEIGGTFTESGGNEAGANPAVISSAIMVDSAGTGAFLLQGTVTLSGTIPVGQTVTAQGNAAGNAAVLLTGTVINRGTVLLDSTNGDFAALETGTAGALDNKAIVKTIEDQHGIRYFEVNITNESGATIEIASADTRVDLANTIANSGTFTVDSTFGISLTAGSSFTNAAGSLNVNGAFAEIGGTFTQSGGVETGNPATVQSATMADSAGTGSFTLTAGVTLSGSIPSGQTITVLGNAAGNASTTLSGTVTNNGIMLLDSTNGDWGLINGGTLDNKGTVKTVQDGGGQRYFEAPIINETGATIEVAAADTRQDVNTLTTNKGAFTVDSGAAIALSGGSSFTNSAGTLTANGTFTEIGGTFTESGGNEAGTNPAVIESAAMVDSAGTGSFVLEASDSLSGTIPSGQTVTLLGSGAGNAIATLTGGTVINSGTLALDSNNGDYALINGGTLDNKAMVQTVQHGGGIRYFEAPITNEAGATIQINTTDTRQDANTVTANSGTLALGDGAHFSLTAGSTLTETASAVTGATVDAVTGTSLLTGGGISLAGTLQVTTVGSPAVGTSYQPIIGTLSGSFSTLSFGSHDYDVTVSGSAVTLTVGNPFVLTGRHVTATEDTPATNVPVATFTDDDQAGSTYTATINWGDSSQSTGTVSTTGTGGTVRGTHTWATFGTFTILTTVTDSTGTTLFVTSTATVHVAPLPAVSTVTPPAVAQGGSANLVLTGTGFTADSAVSFSNAGITIDTVTFVRSTELKVSVDVAANAITGAGNVAVTTDGGTGTCANCLTVNPAPKVTGAGPNMPRGQTTVETVTGTGFQAGLTVTTNIPGATVGTPQGITATTFTASITVPIGDNTGTYRLTVKNPDGGAGSKTCLHVV
jgi:hypothetical protein